MKKFLMTVAVTGLALGTLAGCEEKKPEIKKAAEGVKAAANDAAAKTGEAAKEGAAKAGEAVKDVTKTPAH